MKENHYFKTLADDLKKWGCDLGFEEIRITDIDLEQHERYLHKWLDQGYHGEMSYMEAHGNKRSRPEELIPGTFRVITARMNYLPKDTQAIDVLESPNKAYISRYALGRDYHKVIRARLKKLADKIENQVSTMRFSGAGSDNMTQTASFRAFVDSAPVLEKALAEKSGQGWIGKHTLLINRHAGSWFFLGEIYTNLPLPVDSATSHHCGSCTACSDICPTNAIIGPQQLDARRCISYLTIELKGAIPESLRPLIGNRIFGCDDCQLFCPWNRYASFSQETDYSPRHKLENQDLLELFKWSEDVFLAQTQGSPIRRTGYQNWLRNIAVALGNAPFSATIISALESKKTDTAPSALVKEHIEWAIKEQKSK